MSKILSTILLTSSIMIVTSNTALAIGGPSGTNSYKAAGQIGAIYMNPYKVAPLTAIISNGGYSLTDVEVVVNAKTKNGVDIKYKVSNNEARQHGGIPIWGLYPDYINEVIVKYKRNGKAIKETYKIYAPPVYAKGPGVDQKNVFPKAKVIKTDKKFRDSLYLINHLMRAPLSNAAQAVWNNPVGGAMEWDLEAYVWIIDSNGDIRWYLKTDEIRDPDNIYKKGNMMGFFQTKDGALLWGMGQRYMKYDLMGREIFNRRLPLDYIDFSHHIEETSKGNYLLRVASADYKRSDGKNVRTVRDVIVELDPNGKVVDEWKTFEILDPYRSTNILVLDQGAVCLNVDASKAGTTASKEELEDPNMPWGDVTGVGAGRNWAHINSVNYDPNDDSIILSVRHQSAVIKIGRDKKIKWILSAFDGWEDKFKPYLLQPIDKNGKKIFCENSKCPGYENEEGGFDFTWTQHTAYLIPSMSKKGISYVSVFDNGDTRGMHQPAFSTQKYSRAVVYKIDENKRTVEQVWEYGKQRGFDWYSPITSVSQYFPNTQSMFIYSATAGLGKFLLNQGETMPILNEIDYKSGKELVEIRFEGMGASIGYRALPINLNKAFE
ncbi:aryl-sulfate sulfotransferase [Campylobacter sp. RM16704]|uniref:aryl-sulfate sulfotransferase n=1 Tax=Campylobacter sp. RM16704 TaxID=1500960 RepID=UPI00057D2245|nr:aryl-sulfate sulfotransferase [Campylobacter sp. RM16704]